MKNCFVFGLLLLVNSIVAQGYKRYDSTLKIGKAGFKIFCLNKIISLFGDNLKTNLIPMPPKQALLIEN